MNFKVYEDARIEKYQYLATLDLHTCPICAKLDGKIFPVDGRKVGGNCPPMHEECRCTTISYLDEELMKRLTRSARDPETGKLIKVPLDMTYEQWYDKYVKGNPKARKNTNKEMRK